jgi:hypothetical protein
VNQISVDAVTRKWATVALERMLSIKGSKPAPVGGEKAAMQTVD